MLTHTVKHTHAQIRPSSLYSATPITAFATVVTAITVAAIKGQDSCSLSKIDSNKHLPENSTNPKEQQTFCESPNPTCVNNYIQLKSSKLSQREITHSTKPISTNETTINHKNMHFLNCFHLLSYTVFAQTDPIAVFFEKSVENNGTQPLVFWLSNENIDRTPKEIH